jgi:hypothetical protein
MQRIVLALVVLSLAVPAASHAQQSSSSLIAPELFPGGGWASAAMGSPSSTTPASASRPSGFPGIGVGVKVGLFGVGVEGAVPVGRHLNVRGGGNFFNYSDTLTQDGINYAASLRFRSGEASLDWFPWAGGFHISPGALLYDDNQVSGSANVAAGKTFTLNDTTYTSSATDPVTGTGGLTFPNKTAPKLTVGWGNLVPRNERHFSFPFEVGFAYVGQPKFTLNLAGTACYTYQGTPYCDNVATDSNIQANLAAEQKKISNDAADARFFPILSQGFAVRF